jgi:exodeoxyribonuclease VII large subunit
LALSKSVSRQIHSVSELNQNIKLYLENKFFMIWIHGEISNLRLPSSGHQYFTLKDEKTQIAAVIFRGQMRQLKFELEDGMGILGMGRISVYEPRGIYQLILEYIEPKGIGAMQLAFEQLKRRLEQEGLFDPNKKGPLPFLPRAISVITSPTGAVLHDIIHIINRRFAGIPIDIWPAKVQGDGAAEAIARVISLVNQASRSDVIILARGGGSLEDMAAFNSEIVARSIFSSIIPVISAVGHETDFTIADFVADLRAPTPSAAAELVVPVKTELVARHRELQRRCVAFMWSVLKTNSFTLHKLRGRLVHPSKIIQEFSLRVDDHTIRLNRAAYLLIRLRAGSLTNSIGKLVSMNPKGELSKYRLLVNKYNDKIFELMRKYIHNYQVRLSSALGSIDALNPLAVLRRGYSIVRAIPTKQIIISAHNVQCGDPLEVLLAEGNIKVIVDK